LPTHDGYLARLPTARTHLAAGWLVELVWCKACHHQAPANLQRSSIAVAVMCRPEVPHAKCGSSLTDHVTMSKGGIGVQPWRTDAG
jgi:hypothetical protein